MTATIHYRGITLIELMVAIAVLAIVITSAVPSFTDLISRHRLKGATEKIYQDLQVARSEAIKRGIQVFVSFHTADDFWCYGQSLGNSCDCTETIKTRSDYCQIDGISKLTDNSNHHSVFLTAVTFSGDDVGFDPFRGISTNNGSVILQSRGHSTKVIVSGLGRVRICSNNGALGYPSC